MKVILDIVKHIYHFIQDIFPNHGDKNVVKGVSRKCLVRGGGIWGNNNHLLSESLLDNDKTRCFGDGHQLSIGKEVVFKSGQIKFENMGCKLTIGPKTTIEDAQFFVAEVWDIIDSYIVSFKLDNHYRNAFNNRISLSMIGLGLNEVRSGRGFLKSSRGGGVY